MKKDNNSLLAGKGCRNTKPRLAVIDVLENAELPVTAEEIHAEAIAKGVSINLSTVYRTLEMLEDKCLVEKASIIDGKARFQLVRDIHRHQLICTGCHRMITIAGCPLEDLEKDIGEATKFDITGHRLELYGLCPECRKN